MARGDAVEGSEHDVLVDLHRVRATPCCASPGSEIAGLRNAVVHEYFRVDSAVIEDVGLLANSLFAWEWADSLAALVIAGFAVREGREAWRGEACTVHVAVLTGEQDVEHDHHHDR